MKNQNKKIPEKSLQILACATAVAVMILLMSGDMLISKIIRVNPNQDYVVDENKDNSDSSFNENNDNSGSNEKNNNPEKKDAPSDSTIVIDPEYDVSFMKKSSLVELNEKIDSQETVIVFSGRSTCSPCRRFVPVLKEVASELELTNLYYLDRTTIKETTEGYQQFLAYDDFIQQKFGSTPFLMIFQNGAFQDRILGMASSEEELKTSLMELIQKYNS